MKDIFNLHCPQCDTSLKREIKSLLTDTSDGYRESGGIECPTCYAEVTVKACWSVTYIEVSKEWEE